MRLIGWPTLMAGLILLIAGGHWFSGAHLVGLVLTVVSAVAIIAAFLITILVAHIVDSAKQHLARRR